MAGVVAEAAWALDHAVRRAGLLRVPAYDEAVGVLHDARGRLVFSAAEPYLAVELLKQVLIVEFRRHRRRANHLAADDCKQIPAERFGYRDRGYLCSTGRILREGGDYGEHMDHNVYALLEVRNIGSAEATVDLYKVCPTFEDALEVYREKVGEPKTVREEPSDAGTVWWLDEDPTGAATISRYTLHGPLEEA